MLTRTPWDNGYRDGSKHSVCFKPLSDRSIQLYFVYLRGLFDYMVSEELIDSSPFQWIKQPEAEKKAPLPLDIRTNQQL